MACAQGGAATDSIEVADSAGVVIVTNRSLPRDTVRFSTPVMQIGSFRLEADDAYLFELVSDVAVDADGRIFVVDNRGSRVAAFDNAGEWLHDIGRNGAGPGEHRGPVRLAIAGDTLLVWDALLRRLNRHTRDGAFVDATTIAERNAAAPIVPVETGYLDEIEWGHHMDPSPARGAIVRRSREGAIIDTLLGPFPVPEIGWQWTDDAQRSGMMINPPIFSTRPAWAIRGSDLIWSMPATGQIEVRDVTDGTLRMLIRTSRSATVTTAQDKEAHVDAAIATYGIDPARREAILESTIFADQRPPFATFLVDDRGWIWIGEHDPGRIDRHHTGSTWHGLDPDGALQRTLVFPESFELRILRDGRAWGIARDADGAEVIRMFHIADGGQ